jgi:hypothetical protein
MDASSRSRVAAIALLLGCGPSLPEPAELERQAADCAATTGVAVPGLRARATLLNAYSLPEVTARDLRAGGTTPPALADTSA